MSFIVVCEDGWVRHQAPFASSSEASTFAWWGHACTADHVVTAVPDAVALERARVLAGQWHGGQSTALYALSSTGHVDGPQLRRETAQCALELGRVTAADREPTDAAELAELWTWLLSQPDEVTEQE